ncbi:MAG: beta-propeller fold lactonase family protein [Bacteroidales bacterium]
MKRLLFITMLAIIGLSAKAQTAYITNYLSHSVSIINVATNTVLDSIEVGSHPNGVSVSPDSSKVYITDGSDSVSVINTATNTVTATITVGSGPQGISVSPDGSKVYVANYGANTVSVINTTTNTISATISGFNYPEGISVSPDGSKVYVANSGGSGSVSVINSASNTIVATIAVGINPMGICISSDGSKVYVTNQNSTSVTVINSATNTVLTTITVGNHPYGVSVSPDGSKVYVANYIASTISVINTATNTVTATITVGNGPEGVSVSPDGNKVYVANMYGNSISVINVATNTVTATVHVGNGPHAFGNFISTYSPPPTVHISASEYCIDPGSPTTLTASGATTYSWCCGLGTSNPIIVSPTSTTTYTVTGTTTGGTGTADVTININPTPVITGPTSICSGSSATLDAGVGYSAYLWSSAQTTELITIPPPGTFTVTVYDVAGCSGTASITVTVKPKPHTPVISPAGSYLISSATSGNQWYNDSGILTGQTAQVYTPVVTSHYYCIVDSNGCLSDTSNKIYIVITGINNLSENNGIYIYPNPANDNITIENSAFTKDEVISIFDIQGQLLIKQPMLQAKMNININTFAKGLYFVKVENEKGIAVMKFVKE